MPDEIAAGRLDGDQRQRGQPTLVSPQVMQQRDLDRALLDRFGAGERRSHKGVHNRHIARSFLSYQHPSILTHHRRRRITLPPDVVVRLGLGVVIDLGLVTIAMIRPEWTTPIDG